MKKIMICLLVVSFVFLLTACGGSKTGETIKETESDSADDLPDETNEMNKTDGRGSNNKRGGMQGGNRSGAAGMTVENDTEIQAVLDENADKFEQFTFEDAKTGISLAYSLYIPADYDSAGSYPLIMFIPDSTGSGKSAEQIVKEYYGAAVWAADEDQKKHPSFVLVPAFSDTVVDDNWNTSEQIEAAVNLIAALQENYNIEADRIYTTGQSMGCMASLYLNSAYPDLFAASLFVSGQWDISVLSCLEQQKFFYIVAGGDSKASGGQDEVMTMFDADGAAYSYGSWNAQDDVKEQAAAVEKLLEAGQNANMIRFETGSVLNGGNGMEHMASFNYGYKLSAVRDWLFEQTK